MKKNFIFTGIFFLLITVKSLSGQDIHFSQFAQAPLLNNPALTGAFHGNVRVQSNYRDQWRSIAEPYKTTAVAVDMPVRREHWISNYMGAGVSVLQDVAGDTKVGFTQAIASISGITRLNDEQHLSAGVSGGIVQRGMKGTDLRWDSQYNGSSYDPGTPSGETVAPESFMYGDFSGGLSWHYGTDEATMTSGDQLRANAGIAVHHINRPRQEFYQFREKLYTRWAAHGSMYIGLKNTHMALLPSVLYMRQGPLKEINTGFHIRYRLREESRITGFHKEMAFIIGSYFRLRDAVIPAIMLEYAEFALGISYDVNTSPLRAASQGQGGIEISLRYINAKELVRGKGRHHNVRFL
jgi:type IX secretion system PorP/SprF family membrane protein